MPFGHILIGVKLSTSVHNESAIENGFHFQSRTN